MGPNPNEFFRETTRQWGEALTESLKTTQALQEELTGYSLEACRIAGQPQVWLEKARGLAARWMDANRDTAMEWGRLGAENQKRFWAQVNRTVALAQPGSAAELGLKTQEWWEEAQNNLRTATLALLRANARYTRAWWDCWLPETPAPAAPTAKAR